MNVNEQAMEHTALSETAALNETTGMDETERENLFRKEALAAMDAKHEGRPIAWIPRLWWAFAVLLGIVAVFAAVFLTTATYARKETVVGWLTPDKGLIRLNAGQYGHVEAVLIEEGAAVKEGEPLLILSSDNRLADSGGRTTEALLAEIANEERELSTQIELAGELHIANTASLESNLAGQALERESLQRQIEEQDNRIAIAADLLQRFESLKDKAVADIQIEQQRESLAAQRQVKNSLMQRLHELDRGRASMQDQLQRLPLETAQNISQLRTRQSTLAERRIELSSRGRQALTAPVSGTIASLGARAGSSIDPTRTLVEILPKGSLLRAEVYIPSRAVGFVEVGMPVRLMFEPFPHQRYGSGEGRVSQVTDTVLRPEEIPTPLMMQESAYKARIDLSAQSIKAFGREFPLRPGMALQAEIILEERTFLQWLLEPVMARRGWRPSEEAVAETQGQEEPRSDVH